MLDSRKKKIGFGIVGILTLAAMLCIWPLCIVREDVTEETSSYEYSYTEPVEEAVTVTQEFTAVDSILQGVSVAIRFQGESLNADLLLQTADGECVYETTVQIPQESNGGYYRIPMDVRLKKGAEYELVVTIDNPASQASFLYTQTLQNGPKGCHSMWRNDEEIVGQMVSQFFYRERLNWKNVLCLWAFLLMLSGTILGFFIEWKENRILRKAEELLTKLQYPILALLIVAVTALIVRASLTQAVDWDEAYTYNIVHYNSFFHVVEAQALDPHPALYFLMVKAATLLFGEDILVFKMVSVAGAVATMLLCATLLRRRFGVKAAIFAIPAVGLAPNLIFYNVNVRMYSWMVFWVFAAFLLAYEIVLDEGKRKLHWVFLGLVTLGGIYTMYFAVIPLVLIYAWFLYRAIKDGYLRKWIICCAGIVVAYLPQLYLIYLLLQIDAGDSVGNKATLDLNDLCIWSFETNIKWSEYLPLVAFLLGILCIIFGWKRFDKKERELLILTAASYPFTWVLSFIASANMNHFWANRYMMPALFLFWVFLAVIYAKQHIGVWLCFCVWGGICLFSSYRVAYADEMWRDTYIADAKAALSVVPEGSAVLYDYVTFDTLYRYYLPDCDFVWYEDVDFSELPGNSVYMIDWGGASFPQEMIDEYQISVEYLSELRLERGMWYIGLWKVHFVNE